jgi:hypothetical protein
MPTGLFRIFRKKLLILMSTSVALIGIALIIISQFTTKPGWHESLEAIGAAVFATGPITILVWWVTDDIYRNELSNTLKDIVDEVFKKSEQVNSIIAENKRLGIVGIYLQRVEALNDFKIYMNEEIARAKQGQQAKLWFVCTDLQGFLEVSITGGDPRDILRDAARQENLDLRIMMADPEMTITRSGSGDDSIAYAPAEDMQRKYGVDPSAIRFYAWRPTVFAIATSQYMLLNPYPHQEEAHRCMALIVVKTTEPEQDEKYKDIYNQYLEKHFLPSWKADMTREIDGAPPLLSRINVSRDINETNALLAKEVSQIPPATADLLEFSGDDARDLLVNLANGGTKVRLLLKHPDSVGNLQQQRIVAAYGDLKDRVTPDSLEIKFYRSAPSIRGRRLGTRVLNVGWYTPDFSPKGEITRWEVIEDRNPTVTGNLQTADGQPLADGQALHDMFRRTFDGLWCSGITSSEVDSYIQGLPS